MTKRSCPFDNCFARQLKAHRNDYENDENMLKQIQERTLTRLLEGSRRFFSNDSLESDKLTLPKIQDDPNLNLNGGCDNNKRLVQKCVTSYFPKNGKIQETKSPNIFKQSVLSECFFCSITVGALYRCIKCLELFCSSCSFVSYDSIDEARTCLSCFCYSSHRK